MRLVRLFLAFGVLLVFGWSSGASAVPIQWTVAEGGNGHWYEVVSNGMNWTSAKAYAETRGGYLATVTSAEEHDFIVNNVVPDPILGWGGGLKLGGYQDTSSPSYSEPGGGWSWVTGEAWSYTNWTSGEPNNAGGAENFLTMHPVATGSSEYSWNDNSSGYDFPFIIETVPEPSTALLVGIGLSALAVRREQR